MIPAVLLLLRLQLWEPDPEHNGPPPATDTAVVWLAALQAGRSLPMSAFSVFPFAYREAWAKKRCTQTAAGADALVPLVECTHAQEPRLIAALRGASGNAANLHLTPGLAAAGKRLRRLVGGGKGAWVSGWVKGEGVRYDLVFALTGGEKNGHKIRAVYVDSSAER